MACQPCVDSRFGLVLPVSSTKRPTGVDLYAGRYIYEGDTGRTLMYDGTGWVIMNEPFQTWAPVFASGITVGAGAWSNAGYHRSNGWLELTGGFTFGAGTAVTGTVALTMPVSKAAGMYGQLMTVEFADQSAGQVYQGTTGNDPASPTLYSRSVSGTTVQVALLSATVPFTWATSDIIYVHGRYRMTTRYS